MADWDFQITAPNGAKGHLVVDKSVGHDAIVDQVSAFINSVRENDPEPMEGTAGQPATLQPMRQAKK